mgnify:CR=1 FL=1
MTFNSNPIILIPCRMNSTRLPNKPLADINGMPMIVRVWQIAVKANLGRVIVACGEPEISEVIRNEGGEAVLTDSDLPSRSDRIFAALEEIVDAHFLARLEPDSLVHRHDAAGDDPVHVRIGKRRRIGDEHRLDQEVAAKLFGGVVLNVLGVCGVADIQFHVDCPCSGCELQARIRQSLRALHSSVGNSTYLLYDSTVKFFPIRSGRVTW